MLDIFCPLAEDIGNLADWAAVAVALFGAIAVFQLSRAANATARGVKRVAEREARDRRAAAAREGRLLLIYLENEFRQALTAFGTLAMGLDVVDHDSFIDSGYARTQFLSEADGISLKLSREMFHRLHVLVDKESPLKNPLQAPSVIGDSGTALKDGHPIARIQARKNAIQRSSQRRL
ncbi:hypothetical protein [Xanthomonas campestris]|uniref:hypothetical protein n=1 Tax=Xanthomonas campestris TaxID=339 RepID=UPI002368C350|nr:hypothetical protein [Xanthomonas campestris]WDK43575.1 hypothetical protein JH312_22315 [Xanthomonas campestris pv. campestris]